MRVDFHTHSTASDGTLAPRELAAAGTKAGLAWMALTDHDGCGGLPAFLHPVSAYPPSEASCAAGATRGATSPPTRVSLVAGIELSIEPGPHFDKFHLLGLGIDPTNAALHAYLRKVLEGRNARNERIIANFNRLGFGMGKEIFAYANGEVLARPHFARWLVERGHASTVAEAFAKFLLPDSPKETRCYEERFHPGQEESFALIHAAGGICILAHPKFGRREWRETGPDFALTERALAELKEKGLDGVEAFYQANSVEENIAFTRLADRLGLLKSAGSDFHGSNKPTVTLGMEVSESFIAPLLERLS